jgi:hypothetical protein
MTDRRDDHDTHDQLLIAAWTAGDATADEQHTAAALAAACDECRRLADDLSAIALATRKLPTPSRPRDFTLRREDAARASRRTWRSRLAELATARFDFARPLATGLTTLGLAGLLVASVPSFGGSAAAPTGEVAAPLQADRGNADGGSAAPEEGPAYNDSGAPGAGAASGDPNSLAGEGVDDHGDGRDEGEPARGGDAAAARDPRAASPLVVLSGSFLIVGLGLFGLRWSARRLDE